MSEELALAFKLMGASMNPVFSPKPYYITATDSVIYIAKDVRTYRKEQIGPLKIFRAVEGDEIVGFELSGLSEIELKEEA